ncbi:signal transduction histidine kinase [Sphingomonas leidyi]|uniref:histidine kinase n=1 Tax=Sphingomonas leidyi TaxID=68569 RepID=A0A7X5UZH7_9SPHN|nr:HAMP domain-containing sensor histidine kinase [Sphingomonas leidyi]NIJ65124.1 signal transduction histidine kinase [Sphingomonas leidyi]
MRTPRLLVSGAFRFAIALALVFALGAVALLVIVEHSVSAYAVEAAGDGILAEHDVLVNEFDASGRAELVATVNRHARAVREDQFHYLLVDSAGARLAGSLPAAAARTGWHEFDVWDSDQGGSGRPAPVMAFGSRLSDGALLVVANDVSDLRDLRSGLRISTISFGILISLLALAGGLLVGTLFLRRLDQVNGAIARINDGRLNERLPRIGMGPEFDQLSTNLNRMLDRIEALMDGLRQVSTDIAHDLRTPLTRLRQRLERMQLGTDPAPIPEQVDGAIAQIDEILGIFGALLRIGAMEARGVQASLATADLSEMLERLGQIYAPVIEDAEHVLHEAIAPGIAVRGDVELLTQAVTNLIENALHHTPPGTRIDLALARDGDQVRLSVADDGPGIAAAERTRVLGRFYRIDTSRSTPGAGLGLALVDSIARLHGATLTLADNAPGLRVELRFPRLAA